LSETADLVAFAAPWALAEWKGRLRPRAPDEDWNSWWETYAPTEDELEVEQRRAEMLLGRAVEKVLQALDALESPPSTDELWGLAHASLPWEQWKDGWHPWEKAQKAVREDLRWGYTKAVRELSEPLQQVLLAAHCRSLRSALPAGQAQLIREATGEWIGSLSPQQILAEFRALLDRRDGYEPGYRSPREKELEQIVHDSQRPELERRDAADQISRIRAKRLRDCQSKEEEYSETHHRGGVGVIRVGGARARRPFHGRGMFYNPRDRRRAGRPKQERSPLLAQRYEQLAREEGHDPDVLRQKPGRGKPTPEKAARLRALDRVILALHREHHTDENIGAELGRTRQDIHRARERVISNETKPPT
jgi:hypothetical protein